MGFNPNEDIPISVVNFGPGPALVELPLTENDILGLSTAYIAQATFTEFTQAPLENSTFSHSFTGVQDLSRAGVYRAAGT